MRLGRSMIFAMLALPMVVTTASAERRSGPRALPNQPNQLMQGLARVQADWRADVDRAYARFESAKGFGVGFARNQLFSDLYSANLKAWSAGCQNAAKHTPWGAMAQASVAPFYGVFGGLQIPTPGRYWRVFNQSLESSAHR